ncbi:hypothetical protein F4777DRAFT_540181 [Nemania sp. FL0916]|nr:hypothetical protein F4777DRAFT_540181 [Nemania sp. FL0916]
MPPSESQSPLEALPEELLKQILDHVMTRNSPFRIDHVPAQQEAKEDPTLGNMPIQQWYYPALQIKSSSGLYDPLSIPVTAGCPHHRDKRETHIVDWVIANSVSRHMRRLGRAAFFESKAIAMHSTLPSRLSSSSTSPSSVPNLGFARILAATPESLLLLSHVRRLILVDASEQSPNWMLGLPRLLSVGTFPALREVALIFGHRRTDDPEWITASAAVAEPLWEELRWRLDAIGLAPRISVLETKGTGGGNWKQNRRNLQTYIFPILEIKARALRAKREAQGGEPG